MKSPHETTASSGFTTRFAPREDDIYKCVQCGFCLSSCPTYLETGLEAESPRGRLTLMKAVNEGRLELTDEVAKHWDLCLQCRACEVACPSGVPYGRAMISLRAEMAERVERPARVKLARRFGFRTLLSRPRAMRAVGTLTRFYQRTPLRDLTRSLLARAPRYLRAAEESMPELADDFFVADDSVTFPVGKPVARVSLLAGCVMTMMHPETMRAAVRVLVHNGYQVHVPAGQGCCASMNLHAGERDTAQKMVAKNVEALLAPDVDAVVTVSAGCGSTMKEYGELVPGVDGAEELAEKTQDIHELLAAGHLRRPSGELTLKVAYQDPCHLLSTQRISEAPRQVLRAIDGLQLADLPEANICCGSAGTYSISQREMSVRLGDRKARHVADTGAAVVATANPGCASQLESAMRRLGRAIEVRYVVDLLDEAYRRGGDYDQRLYAGEGASTNEREAAAVALPASTG